MGADYDANWNSENYDNLSRAIDSLAIAWAAPITEIRGAWACIKHGDWWGGRCTMFTVPLCEEWVAGSLLLLLEHNGIDVYEYGVSVVSGLQFVKVDTRDERRTQRVLSMNGLQPCRVER